jgi:hypothetical protein
MKNTHFFDKFSAPHPSQQCQVVWYPSRNVGNLILLAEKKGTLWLFNIAMENPHF